MTTPTLAEQREMLDLRKLDADIAQSLATTAKLNAETAKIQKETKFYPLVYLLTGMAGGIAVTVIQEIAKF